MVEAESQARQDELTVAKRSRKRKSPAPTAPPAKRQRFTPVRFCFLESSRLSRSQRIVPLVQNPSEELLAIWKQQFFKLWSYIRSIKDFEVFSNTLSLISIPHQLF